MFSYSRVASSALLRSRVVARRLLSEDAVKKEASASAKAATEKTAAAPAKEGAKAKTGWWYSAELWGGLGAVAGWGMSLSAIYDATIQGPEVISLTMTPVLIVYSSLFARWAWIVKPQNLLLCSCHVANVGAQLNQLRRGLQYKIENGEEEQVNDMARKAGMAGVALAGGVLAGPTIRSALSNANLGVVSTVAAADAGPFTVHFWAPMSKWCVKIVALLLLLLLLLLFAFCFWLNQKYGAVPGG